MAEINERLDVSFVSFTGRSINLSGNLDKNTRVQVLNYLSMVRFPLRRGGRCAAGEGDAI